MKVGFVPRAFAQDIGWGSAPNPSFAGDIARSAGLSVTRVNPAEAAAEDLEQGRVVGWAQGRFEFGPRALGRRSLLVRADRVEMRDLMNRKVKKREPFRPFAPAVLDANYGGLFTGAPDETTRYMTTVRPVENAGPIAAAVHEDGTSRVQTVDPATPFGALLETLDAKGITAVLNTSLNSAGQPIVASGGDAIAFLLAHPVDALYVEDLRISSK